MTIPANLQSEIAPWGSIPVTVCWGTQGGPYNTASAANPLPVAPSSNGNPGSAIPGQAGMIGVNVGGNLRAVTGSNPTGSVFTAQVDLVSVNGTVISTNQGLTLLSSAARTATTTSADQLNPSARGAQVVLNVTANASAAGIQLQIQGKDPVSGNYYNLTAAPTAVTGTGNFIYELYPGIGAASGDVTQRTSASLPSTFRVKITHGDASSVTYSVGASLIR
jgi:hypothetical protein